MKISFTKTVRILLSLFFVFFIIQGLSIAHFVSSDKIPNSIRIDIHNALIITSFIGFSFFAILFLLIPQFLKKSFFEINHIVEEITKGNYQLDPKNINSKSKDIIFRNVADLMNQMVENLRKFDDLKKEKIIEHRNRVIALLRLSTDGFIITNAKGDIVYVSNVILNEFPEINVDSNLLSENFIPIIEKSIKKYAVSALKSKTVLEPTKHYIPTLKKHVDICSSLIRNNKGEIIGAIIGVLNIEIKSEKNKDKKNDSKIS
ncbi:MAG: hypothetical protein U9N34_06940 [Candidatus Cloacimonadota bacterium]|nr:hypothetical protein [Candidatus Cloacimonadota bacterium]